MGICFIVVFIVFIICVSVFLLFFFFLRILFVLMTGSPEAQAVLALAFESLFLLFLPLECWDYICVAHWLAFLFLRMFFLKVVNCKVGVF